MNEEMKEEVAPERSGPFIHPIYSRVTRLEKQEKKQEGLVRNANRVSDD